MSNPGPGPVPPSALQTGHAGYTGNPPIDIDKHIGALTNKVLGFVITAVLFWFIGAAIGVFWEMNGTIHGIDAREVVSREVYDFKVTELMQRNQELERRIRSLECLKDEAVKDKAGCHQ